MTTNNTRVPGDQAPVVGGKSVPAQMFATPAGNDDVPDDDLGLKAYWLLKLHPEVSLRFRKSDLQAMDDNTKLALIADIEYALGLQPLQGDTL